MRRILASVAGAKPGVVLWKADKVVNGQREPMGEMDVTYDAAAKCWSATFSSPRASTVWCLMIEGDHMTGSGTLLPGKQTVRKIDAKRLK